jgi:hypothetical protein
MNTVTKIALSKGIKLAKEDKAIEGRHHVSALVRIEGDIVVGKDSDRASTASLLTTEFFAMILHASGITREAAMAKVSEVAEVYLKGWTGTDEEKAAAKKLREEALAMYDFNGKCKDMLAEAVKKLPRTPVSGSVKFEGEISEVVIAASESEMDNVTEIGRVG